MSTLPLVRLIVWCTLHHIETTVFFWKWNSVRFNLQSTVYQSWNFTSKTEILS